MIVLLADLRHAVRLYARAPVPSLIAVVVLAVGMAFVGAFLSLYVDLVLKPHPGIEDSGEIVTIAQVDGNRFNGIPLALIERADSEMSAVTDLVGYAPTSLPVGPEGENALFEMVTPGFFEGIRPRLAMGRGFDRNDHHPDAEPVIVLSDRYWREQFDASPDVLGTTIEVTGRQPQGTDNEAAEDGTIRFRIVGVMVPELRGLYFDDAAFWAPVERVLPVMYANSGMDFEQIRPQLTLLGLGRLADGASAEAVLRELEMRYPESTDEYRLQPGFRMDAVDGIVLDINVYRDARRQLQLFLAGSILLALVAAANVSLFLLARAPGRRRELAIRMSVGAPLRRLARQLASEAGFLVVVSAALGLLASIWLGKFLQGLAFLRRAEWGQVTLLDWRVLGLVGVFLLLLTVLVSLAPIVGLKRLGIASSSRQVAARATLAQRIAGTVQIAIAGTLGGAAIAFGWYLGSMTLGYPGYETVDRYRVQFAFFNPSGGNDGSGFQTSAVDAARNREVIESIPGVDSVTLSSLVPAAGSVISTMRVPDPSDPTSEISIGTGIIDERFVDVLNLRLLFGRAPAENENGVVLVNQSLAQLYFGRDDVAGETLEFRLTGGQPVEITGVLEDLSFVHPAADVGPILFTKQPPSPFGVTGIVEASLTAAALQQQLAERIESGELELGRPLVSALSDLRSNMIAPDRARSLLTIGTASLVVLLAAFGFYGTQRYLVTAGRREYAIRASLGAGPRALGRLVFRRGLMLSLPGLVLGGLLAFILVAWLRDDFISREIPPGTVTLIVVAGLAGLLAAASLGPARQARRTQPAPLLREE